VDFELYGRKLKMDLSPARLHAERVSKIERARRYARMGGAIGMRGISPDKKRIGT
jgi:hypothetical protein